MKNRKGFTIVELVIVIAVIAILAAVLIPTFATVISKANQSNATQTATNALKAGLLMTNTAQLPKDTLIIVDSDKKASTKPDYGFNYENGNEVKEITIYDGDSFVGNIAEVGTILIGDVVTATTTTGENPTTTYSLDNVVKGILNVAKNAASYDAAVTVEKDGDSYVITVNGTAFKAFTSVDMPKNTVIFVNGTKEAATNSGTDTPENP